MGHAIPVRTDYTAGEVRRFAQRAPATLSSSADLKTALNASDRGARFLGHNLPVVQKMTLYKQLTRELCRSDAVAAAVVR